jgi:hypothetical protein
LLVGVLISIMISIVVGVNLLPTIVTSIGTTNDAMLVATTTNNTTTYAYMEGFEGLAGLTTVLAYVYVAVILLGAVAWIGGQA